VAHFRVAVNHYPNNVELKLNLLLAIMQCVNTSTIDAVTAAEMVDEAVVLISSLESLPSAHKAYQRYQSLASQMQQLQDAA